MESKPANQEIQFLADELKDHFHPNAVEDAKLVQKGLMLYRQGLVTQLHIGAEEVTAIVQDVTPAKVQLNLTFLPMSTCTCPGDDMCRHQLAVFFAAYATMGSITEWVEEWREPIREKKAVASWGMRTAKDLIKANGALKPDYSRWVHSFEVSFDTLLGSKKFTSPFVVAELFGIYERRVRASAPMEQEWRLLYEVVGIVVSFKKLATLSEQAGHSEDVIKRAYLHLFHNMIDDAEDIVGKIGVQSMPFDFDEFILHLKDEAFDLLTVVSGREYERVYLYRLLWTGLFRKKEWREEEVEKIRVRLKNLEESENETPLMIAQIHLNLLLHNDDLTLKLIDFFEDEVICPYMIHWIDVLTTKKAWKRVGPLVELLVQKIKGYLEDLGSYLASASFTKTALKAMAPYCVENSRLDLYERMLLLTLPYSFADYEHWLFERRQFDRWSELQAFVGLSYFDLPKDLIKVVEKERPEVLFGMLHQTVQSEIDQRNRQSYKMAVRHLKKLRTLYKKTKRLDDWQFFFDTLMDRTKRLRAFHDECRRSKLLSERE